jgi:hypothetical protein
LRQATNNSVRPLMRISPTIATALERPNLEAAFRAPNVLFVCTSALAAINGLPNLMPVVAYRHPE